MPITRFVQTGRVAYVGNGPHAGKLVAIVDVVDQNRVLIDGPSSGVPRGQMRLKDLHLTKFKIGIPYTGPTRIVRKAWVAAKIDEKWKNTIWAKKAAAKAIRANLGDFDRFKLRKAKTMRNKIRTQTFTHLKNVHKRAIQTPAKDKSAAPKEKKAVRVAPWQAKRTAKIQKKLAVKPDLKKSKKTDKKSGAKKVTKKVAA